MEHEIPPLGFAPVGMTMKKAGISEDIANFPIFLIEQLGKARDKFDSKDWNKIGHKRKR